MSIEFHPWVSYAECSLQRSAKVDAPGFVNFAPAVAYHFCLNLPAAFTQSGAPTLADLCTNIEHSKSSSHSGALADARASLTRAWRSQSAAHLSTPRLDYLTARACRFREKLAFPMVPFWARAFCSRSLQGHIMQAVQ